MTKLHKKYFSALIKTSTFIYAFFMPWYALAQTNPTLDATAKAAGLPVPSGPPNPIAIAASITNIALGFVGVLLVVLVVYAGFKWMTSGGNENAISEAKTIIRNAVIGLIIVFLAFIIAKFIFSTFHDSSVGACGIRPAGPCPPGSTLVCQGSSWTCQQFYGPPPP